MARYASCLDLPEVDFDAVNHSLQTSISRVLESCDLSIIYSSKDYVVAKEKPGKINLSELTTIEVLIHPPNSLSTQVQLNLVVKNDQLPLKSNNHCKRVFESIHQAILRSMVNP